MKEHPILYSTTMVQAKLAGTKTQTRRLRGLENVNDHQGKPLRLIGDSRTCDHPRPAIKYDDRLWFWWTEGNGTWDKLVAVRCPYNPGDLLWTRETFCKDLDAESEFLYRATNPEAECEDGDGSPWKPSIHMPKEAARIWERVTDIRVERLQDITDSDAIAEGIQPLLASGVQLATHGRLYKHYTEHQEGLFGTGLSPIKSYQTLWESINGEGSWSLNPWVWVIQSEILSTTGRPKELTASELEAKHKEG
jgi:hypothetical protein